MSWLEVINIFNDWNKWMCNIWCSEIVLQSHFGAKSFVFILQGMDSGAQNVLHICYMEKALVMNGEFLYEKVYIKYIITICNKIELD